VTASRSYAGHLSLSFELDEPIVLSHVLTTANIPKDIRNELATCQTPQDLESRLREKTETLEEGSDVRNKLQNASETLAQILGGASSVYDAAQNEIQSLIPEFFYFAQYSSLPYSGPYRQGASIA